MSLAGDLNTPVSADFHPRPGPLALALAFGDAVTKADALASLDTLDIQLMLGALTYLLGPRQWEALQELALAIERRGREADSVARVMPSAPSPKGYLFWGYAHYQGQLRAARRFAEAQAASTNAFSGVGILPYSWAALIGVPVPSELLDVENQATALADLASGEALTVGGALAAQRGDWETHTALMAQLRGQAQASLADGDSAAARSASVWAELLEAYGKWRRGDVAAALPTFERHFPGRRLVQWWLGDVYLELGRLRKAEQVFRTYVWNQAYWAFSWHPLAHQRLGLIYDRLAEREMAARAYAYFVDQWRDADPELQPLVRAAERRLQELTAERS